MYGTQTRPQILDLGKAEGKCALYALHSLLLSIKSIDDGFRSLDYIKEMMMETVTYILWLLGEKMIPNNPHFYPGDMI